LAAKILQQKEEAVIIAWNKIYRWLENAEEDEIREQELLPYMWKIVLNVSRDLYNSEKRQRMRILGEYI
jgi:hypothetical protein